MSAMQNGCLAPAGVSDQHQGRLCGHQPYSSLSDDHLRRVMESSAHCAGVCAWHPTRQTSLACLLLCSSHPLLSVQTDSHAQKLPPPTKLRCNSTAAGVCKCLLLLLLAVTFCAWADWLPLHLSRLALKQASSQGTAAKDCVPAKLVTAWQGNAGSSQRDSGCGAGNSQDLPLRPDAADLRVPATIQGDCRAPNVPPQCRQGGAVHASCGQTDCQR